MNPWKLYDARLDQKGHTKRDTHLARTQNYLSRSYADSLFTSEAIVQDDVYSPERTQRLAVLNSDNLNMKTILTVPGERILCGSTIFWADNYWLVTELDANDVIYTKAIMEQCNYVLRWVTPDLRVVERHCIMEDGTKYLTGEDRSSYNDVGITVGDSRIAITLPRDKDTLLLNRDNRFLVDDYGSGNVLAYQLTKPLKVGKVYNDRGVFSFVLQEVNSQDTDDFENHIADYYKYFPKPVVAPPNKDENKKEDSGKKVWL